MNDFDVQLLAKEWCSSFELHKVGDDLWSIASSFIYEDGDGLPVFLQQRDGAWHLTDLGMTFSHLYFDEYEHTDARLRALRRVVSSSGFSIEEDTHRVWVKLAGHPTAYDIADFLQAISEVRGAALASVSEHEQRQYRTQLRNKVVHQLATPNFDENWAPPMLQKRQTYRADLRLPVPAQNDDIVLFLASTSERATRAAICVDQFKRNNVAMTPLLAYRHSTVSSQAVSIFQDYAEASTAVLPVEPTEDQKLVRTLATLGVPFSET